MAPCDAKDRIRQLEAEVARLTQALSEIASASIPLELMDYNHQMCAEIARAALAVPQQNKETGNG